MEIAADAFGLAGRVCVVTGAGSGIGRGVAVALAGQGASVAILDRDEAGAQETLDLVAKAGAPGLAVRCDVSETASIEAAQRAVHARFGDAHVLVNNAGLMRPGALATLPLADWNALLAVNLTGYFQCAQLFGRPMLERGEGVLVHVSSITATVATPYAGAYSVAKAGVSMMSRLLAVEWGPSGVRSNTVAPGIVQTALVKEVYDQPGMVERRGKVVPLGRIGQPDDIAPAVLFLASPLSQYVNGAEIVVDGAFSHNFMTLIPRTGFEPPAR